MNNINEDVLLIRPFTDPVLHKSCYIFQVGLNPTELEVLANKMIWTTRINNGCGLAANQVGLEIPVCVVILDNGVSPMILVEPKIVSHSKKKSPLEEGCLSAPKIRVSIKRWNEITVEYKNLTGKTEITEFNGLNARIIQHEIAHLQGFTIVDKFLPNTAEKEIR